MQVKVKRLGGLPGSNIEKYEIKSWPGNVSESKPAPYAEGAKLVALKNPDSIIYVFEVLAAPEPKVDEYNKGPKYLQLFVEMEHNKEGWSADKIEYSFKGLSADMITGLVQKALNNIKELKTKLGAEKLDVEGYMFNPQEGLDPAPQHLKEALEHLLSINYDAITPSEAEGTHQGVLGLGDFMGNHWVVDEVGIG